MFDNAFYLTVRAGDDPAITRRVLGAEGQAQDRRRLGREKPGGGSLRDYFGDSGKLCGGRHFIGEW